MLFVFNKTSS